MAADVTVLSASDTLRPGLPETVWVAALHDGQPDTRPPVVDAEGAKVRFGSEGGSAGVWPLVVIADPEADEVRLTVRAFGAFHTAIIDVGWPDPGELEVPERVDGLVQGDPIRIPITGPSVPPPELLEVVVGEGVVHSIERVEGGLEVVLIPSDSPFPRVIPFGVRDVRGSGRPTWSALRLRARPRIPLRAEPGAELTLEVGGRSYGPFVANRDGEITARVDQYPGESIAKAVFTDDLGNRTTSTVPLASRLAPSLIAMPGGRSSPQGRPDLVYLRAIGERGRSWRGAPASCRSPAIGDLDVYRISSGLYAVPLAGRFAESLVDVRLECRLGDDTATSVRVGPPPGVPARLLLQVWPTELSTDLPLAEVRIAMEDARGQRLSVEGIEVTAEHGEVRVEVGDGDLGVGEYRGDAALEAGVDRIIARYVPTRSGGAPVFLELAWDAANSLGLPARVRALDAQGRPVEHAAVTLSGGAASSTAETGPDGWARAMVRLPSGTSAIVLAATAEGLAVRTLALRSTAGRTRMGTALEVSRDLILSPGRLAGISVNVNPPILRTGRGSVAYVTVLLEDRSGNPIREEDVRIEASEGSVGPLLARPDGTWMAEYTPSAGDRAREVTITARTESLRSTARLTLEPRLGRLAVGPQVGWISNFGSLSSPVVGFDADIRTGFLGETVILRLGVSGYGLVASAPTGFGEDAELVGNVFPGIAAVLLRQDRGGFGFWGGAGGLAGLHTLQTRFGTTLVSRGNKAVSGGVLIAGGSYRLGLGDLVTEVRWTSIPASGGELGFTGNLGGLAAGLGFRLVY